MNGKQEPGTDDDVSVLFRFYTRKVFSRIRAPENPGIHRGKDRRDTGKKQYPADRKTG